MAYAPAVNQYRGVTHSNDPVTIIDYPKYVSIYEWGGAIQTAFGVAPILTFPPVGTGVAQPFGSSTTDDSLAINAALVALAGTGLTLFFPQGNYLVSANAIVNAGNVPCEFAPGATVTGTNAATLLNQGLTYSARGVVTSIGQALSSGSGTGTLTFANGAFGTQDGIATLAVGDTVLLQGGTLGSYAGAAKDSGPWVISSLGGASAPAVLVRPSWWVTGAFMPRMGQITVGPEGTAFGGTQWSSWASPGTVIGTTDPAFYPDRVLAQGSLSTGSGTLVLNTIPLRSVSKTVVIPTLSAVGGTNTAAVTLQPLAITAGYVGTATVTIQTLASAFAANAVASTNAINVLVANR